jgi:hypothetical protein
VADIITRVVADRAGKIDRLAGLRRIGIDEISYRYAGDLVIPEGAGPVNR